MKRWERVAASLWLAAFGMCGCTRSSEVKQETHLAEQATVQSTETEHETETVQRGPETITTTVEEYGAPQANEATQAASGVPVQGQVGQGDRAAPEAEHPAKAAAGLALIKRTVTVDQRGPTVVTATAEAKGASTAALVATSDAKADTKRSTRWGPPWWLYVCGVLALAGAGWAAWKMQPAWVKALRAML